MPQGAQELLQRWVVSKSRAMGASATYTGAAASQSRRSKFVWLNLSWFRAVTWGIVLNCASCNNSNHNATVTVVHSSYHADHNNYSTTIIKIGTSTRSRDPLARKRFGTWKRLGKAPASCNCSPYQRLQHRQHPLMKDCTNIPYIFLGNIP